MKISPKWKIWKLIGEFILKNSGALSSPQGVGGRLDGRQGKQAPLALSRL